MIKIVVNVVILVLLYRPIYNLTNIVYHTINYLIVIEFILILVVHALKQVIDGYKQS